MNKIRLINIKHIRNLIDISLKFKRLTDILSFLLFLGSIPKARYVATRHKNTISYRNKTKLAFQNTSTEMILLDSWA